MKKIVESGKWVPLKYDLDSPGVNLEGLLGIEELKDYEIVNSNGKRSKKNVKNKKNISSDDEDTPPVKKSKTEKKKQKSVKNEKNLKKENKNIREREENEIENTEVTINKDSWSSLGVPDVVIKALNDQKFQTPTLIQSLTLAPAILGRRDILGAAETGCGKTLAFGIPIINGIIELKKKLTENERLKNDNDDLDTNSEGSSEEEEIASDYDDNKIGCVKVVKLGGSEKTKSLPKKPLYALILTPTRELAVQIKNHLKNAAKYTDLQIAVVVGGMAAVKQERVLSKGPEIVIATPGRLWELLDEGNEHLSQIDSIRFLAIDETDRLLERGHFQELHALIERLNADEKKVQRRQNFVFSATLSLVHEVPDYLMRKKYKHVRSKIAKLTSDKKLKNVIEMLQMKNPKVVDITQKKGTAEGLTECRIACTIDHKDYYLYYFLKKYPGRTLVFCNSIGCVKRLTTLLSILECKPLPLHANMIQKQRLKNLERFQENDTGLLIATNVAARGLDIPNVDHVVHYQVPRTSEDYVHRSGRTARNQKEGITVLIMEPSENQFYIRLCKTLGRTQDIPTFPVIDHLLISVKERVDIARQIDKLELHCKRNNMEKDWIKKAVEEMDIILDDDQKKSTMGSKESADLKKELKIKKHQLNSLLSRPLFPKGFSGKYPEVNVELSLENNQQKAIDVMKKAIEEIPLKRKRDRETVNVIKKNRKAIKQKLKKERRNKNKEKKEKNAKKEK